MRACFLRLFAGLGNQQFQFAYAYSVSKEADVPLKIDDSYYWFLFHPTKEQGYHYPCKLQLVLEPDWFIDSVVARYILGIMFSKSAITRICKLILGWFGFRIFDRAQVDALEGYRCAILRGYFHDQSLIEKYREEITRLLRIDVAEAPSEDVKSLLDEAQLSSNSISLHVRRGDYVDSTKQHIASHYENLSVRYYEHALELIKSKAGESADVYIFSDDIAWCRDNLNFESATFVSLGSLPDGDFWEQQVMMRCTHHIIANSTFSWMGAWCGVRPGMVCFPKRWFADEGKDKDLYMPIGWTAVHN